MLLLHAHHQCNSSDMLTPRSAEYCETDEYNENNIMTLIDEKQKVPKCIVVPRTEDRLILLPGHSNTVCLDERIAYSAFIANLMSGNFANTVGMMAYGIRTAAYVYGADTVLIDMSPSGGSFNKLLVLTSNAFIVPATGSPFVVQALSRSSGNLYEEWKKIYGMWENSVNFTSGISLILPTKLPKLIGVVANTINDRKEDIERLATIVETKFVPRLIESGYETHPKPMLITQYGDHSSFRGIRSLIQLSH